MNPDRPVIAQPVNDESLITRILNGETHLYEQLIRKYNSQMYRISMSIVNDDKEAEDAMQTAYINAYRQLPNFKFQSSFNTWLTRILINESLLRKKRKLKLEKVITETAHRHNNYQTITPLDALMNKELKQILENAVLTLPEKYRAVFIMREVQGMSTNETMEALDLGESNVKIRLTRAKEMLRQELNTYWQPKEILEFNLLRCDVIVNYVMNELGIGN
jgi:RNA polymerase sigma-70 factor (ECF subfamily)